MKILHVSAGYWPYLGGTERFLQEISERLARNGHEVTVVCGDALTAEHYWIPGRPRAEPATEVHRGVRIYRSRVAHLLGSSQTFPNLRRLAMLLSLLPGTLPVLRRIGRHLPWIPDLEPALNRLGPFDLVHAANISLESPLIAAWRYARRRGLPFISTPFVHTGVPGERFVERHYTMPHQLEVLRDSDLVFVQTEIEARRLAELGVPRERMALLGMGVNPHEARVADPESFRREHGLSGPLVAFVGSITRDKGAIHLVEACRALWHRHARPVTLALAGSPVTEFNRYYAALPGEDRARVRLLGAVSEADKWSLLAAADALAVPSRVDSFGIVYLEAWTAGTPVIGARAGGVPAVIDDGVDGLLVPYGDVEALVRAMKGLLDDPERARAMGARGREKVARRYTWELVAARLSQHYEGLASNPAPPVPRAAITAL